MRNTTISESSAGFPAGDGGVAIDSPQMVHTAEAVFGTNSISWNPTVTIARPAHGQLAGTCTGTITHSLV